MLKLTLFLMVFLLLANICLVTVEDWIPTMAESMIFHFLGGFLAAMLVFSLYHNEFAKLSQPIRLLTIMAMTLMIGVFWEFTEYTASVILSGPIYNHYHTYLYFIGDLNDTLQDLAMDGFGALGFLIVWFGFKSKN